MKISSVYELNANEYNTKLAEALKQIPEFKAPEWSFFVKTGVSKVKPPQEPDFWFKRAASILRQAYVRKIVGVNRLKTRYGSKQNRGMQPEIFRRASGKMIRIILQQAEAAGLLEKYNVPEKRAGRKLTIKGKELMESIGSEKQETNKQETKPIDNANANFDISQKDKIIEKEIDKTEKEIVEDVAEGASKENIKEDIKEAKEEIKEKLEEVKE